MERPGRDSARDIRELSRGPRTETATWTWPSPCSIPFAEVCIEELPADDRAVVLLRDVEGLSRQEIAEALGLTVVTVKKRVHRARLFLRKRLDALLSIAGAGSPMHVAAPSTFLAALREKFASAHPIANNVSCLAVGVRLALSNERGASDQRTEHLRADFGSKQWRPRDWREHMAPQVLDGTVADRRQSEPIKTLQRMTIRRSASRLAVANPLAPRRRHVTSLTSRNALWSGGLRGSGRSSTFGIAIASGDGQ